MLCLITERLLSVTAARLMVSYGRAPCSIVDTAHLLIRMDSAHFLHVARSM